LSAIERGKGARLGKSFVRVGETTKEKKDGNYRREERRGVPVVKEKGDASDRKSPRDRLMRRGRIAIDKRLITTEENRRKGDVATEGARRRERSAASQKEFPSITLLGGRKLVDRNEKPRTLSRRKKGEEGFSLGNRREKKASIS